MLQAILDTALAILVLVIAAVVVLAVRRHLLQRGNGTFDCSLKLRTPERLGVRPGVRSGVRGSAGAGSAGVGPPGASGAGSAGGEGARAGDAGSGRARKPAAGQAWVLGIGRYTGNTLEWFRVFSFSPRPRKVFHRGDLRVRSSRCPLASEALGLYDGHVIVEVTERGGVVELAMAEDARMGFLAWLEAAPPGASAPGAARPMY